MLMTMLIIKANYLLQIYFKNRSNYFKILVSLIKKNIYILVIIIALSVQIIICK